MIDWLKRVFHSGVDLIPESIRQWVYSMIHAVAGIMNTVLGHVGLSWRDMLHAGYEAGWALLRLSQGIHHFYQIVKDHWLPQLRKYLLHLLSEVKDYAKAVYHYAVFELKKLKDLAWSWIKNLRQWVLDHIWKPIYAWVKDLYKKMTDWAYTAWWYITHPDKLAERLFWFSVDLVKRFAWDLARIFGEFGAKTVLANIPRVVALIEKMIADVL